MKKNIITALVFGLSALAISGCAIVRSPVAGGIYTDVQSGTQATGHAMSKKMGESCAMSILGLVGTGDASITTAAKMGGVRTISHVDEYATSILGVYGKLCTRVYGD